MEFVKRDIVADLTHACEKTGNLVESVGNNSTFFPMPSATSFFCTPKKMKQKKGAPAGGLHSANSAGG